MNTSAPLFADQNFDKETEKNLAEIYCRLYALAAEDFTTTADVNNYIRALTECVRAMQQQLSRLFKVVSSHTHNIPPHTHPLVPHTHICAQPGYPSSPTIGPLATLATPLITQMPVESSQIVWTEVQPPQYHNTTGAPPNLNANMITIGPTRVGPLTMNERRAKTPAVLLQPTVLPLVQGMAKI